MNIFTRKKVKDQLKDEQVEAEAALELSRRDLGAMAGVSKEVISLAERLKAIQGDNHFAARIRLAYKA